MESNIKKMNMKEILSNVGFPTNISEFRNTYKFNVDSNIAMEFENKLKQIKAMSEIEQIICKYEDIFDKEIYVFHMARLLKKDIENIKIAELLEKENINQLVFTNDITGKNKRRFFVNAKNLLKNCNVIDIIMKKSSEGEQIEIYSSIDFINQNTEFSDSMKNEALKKLEKIENQIGLKNVLAHLKDSDLSDICKYSNLAIMLIVNQEELDKKIIKYIQYIDLDKMLVLANSSYFYKYSENFYNFSKEEENELIEFTNKVSNIVGNKIKFLQTTKFSFTIDYNEIKEKVKKLSENGNLEIEKETNETIIEEDDNKENVENKSSTSNHYINDFTNNENKIVIDFENRKNTISKLDEKYTQENLNDGATVFYLPNKECYIIETTNNKDKFCGATYIINKDLFESQKDILIEDLYLNQKELSILKLKYNKEVTKLVYTGWENAITTFFNMKTEEKYTEEEMKNINEILEKVKK